ncbi:Probable arabinosyltransferase ARAD1 [Linum perenne]
MVGGYSPIKISQLQCSISSTFFTFIAFSLLSLLFFHFYSTSSSQQFTQSQTHINTPQNSIKVYVANLPRSLNYGLLERYWSSSVADTRISSDPDHPKGRTKAALLRGNSKFPPYPENPVIKQYSAEYWMLGDLMTPEGLRTNSFAKRVFDERDADVVFVPFFATLSTEMELARGKGTFRKKEGNEDYLRQKETLDFVMNTDAWKRSGGRDHVFVITDPVGMWHVKAQIAPAVLLVVDFGGWHRIDSKSSNGSSSERIQHTQVSLLKDVIVPYTHLLPQLPLSENSKRHTLLYFKGAKHRHGGGVVREKLWDLLVNEPGVIMEEGFPNATGREQSIRGMRTSEFCLHPAGDTPTSCRLFDAIQSLCIPVIVSDSIELPFEGMVDYSEFSIFVATADALTPNWLAHHLRSISERQKDEFRQRMSTVQPIFQYDSGHPGGIGPVPPNGAVNYIWRKVHQKLPMIKEAIVREKRRPSGVSVPLRCQCS